MITASVAPWPNEQMRESYQELLRLAHDQPSAHPAPGKDPTPEQLLLLSLSHQITCLSVLVFGILARTGIVRDMGFTAEDAKRV